MENLKLDLISAKNSVLLLVDYQPNMFMGVQSGDRTEIKNAALPAAKAAQITEVPVVYTSVWPEGHGEFIKELSDLFSRQKVISRSVPGFDAFEDEKVLSVVKAAGRNKLIVSSLCIAFCLVPPGFFLLVISLLISALHIF